MLKQVIIVRQDLKMGKGKLATQCAHASVESVLVSEKSKVEDWKKNGAKKVILKVYSQEELINYFKMAKNSGIKVVLIKDSGKTFFKKPTLTCIGLGPDLESKIDKISGKLKMF